MKILIVDDDRACLEMWLSVCESIGECTATDSPKQAMFRFRTETPAYDLIITDYNMPLVTGLALAEHMRTFERNNQMKSTPIICITGMQEDVLRFNEKAGKPITHVMCKGSIKPAHLRDIIYHLIRIDRPPCKEHHVKFFSL